MNKTIISIILFSLYSVYGHSQTNNLLYKFTEQKNELTSSYNLLHTSDISHWYETGKRTVDEKKTEGSYIEDENYTRKHVYKDFKNEFTYSNYDIYKHKFYVKDQTGLMHWTITDSTETIMGFKCQIAKTTFRGRNYFVSFTKDIPNSDGPWKFQGLPGMILKVISDEDNEYYKMECIKIESHNEDVKKTFISFTEKYKNKFITWDEFIIDVDGFIKKYIKNLKSSEEAEEGGGYSIKIRMKNQKEIFHKKLQTSGIMIEM